MSTLLILVLSLATLAFVWYRMRRPRAAQLDFADWNEKFLRNESGKSGTAELLRFGRNDDQNLLRSLLDAEGIESFVADSRIGELYPLQTISEFGEGSLVVFEADLPAARRVLDDYRAASPVLP